MENHPAQTSIYKILWVLCGLCGKPKIAKRTQSTPGQQPIANSHKLLFTKRTQFTAGTSPAFPYPKNAKRTQFPRTAGVSPAFRYPDRRQQRPLCETNPIPQRQPHKKCETNPIYPPLVPHASCLVPHLCETNPIYRPAIPPTVEAKRRSASGGLSKAKSACGGLIKGITSALGGDLRDCRSRD